MTDWDTMRALLAGAPNLHGARCKGRSDLFERTVGEHHMTGQITLTELDDARRDALRLCETCPALNPCRAWLSALPTTQRPRGVVAGQVVHSDGRILTTQTQGEASPTPAPAAPRGLGSAPPGFCKKTKTRGSRN